MTRKERNVTVFQTPTELADFCALHFIEMARVAISSRGRFCVALAGGTTPKTVYELLGNKYREQIEWSRVFLFWGDERFVDHENPDSTYLMIKNTLIDNVPIPQQNIVSVETTAYTPEEAAKKYSEKILTFRQNSEHFLDLVLLGMGSDGHTASLFPNSPTLTSDALVAVEYDSPKPPKTRITMTFNTVNSAREVIILVTGSDKADMLAKVFRQDTFEPSLPITGVVPLSTNLKWYIDTKAATMLSK